MGFNSFCFLKSTLHGIIMGKTARKKQTQENNSAKHSQNLNTFSSGKEFCNLCKSEYDGERERTKVIDSKTNIVISFTAVFFVALTQTISLAKLLNFKITTVGSVLLPVLALSLIIGALVLTLISIIFFARVICMHTYLVIEPRDFYDNDILSSNQNDFAVLLATKYIEATQTNCIVNNKRTKSYCKGLILLIISIALFAMYMCLNSFI